MRVAFLSFQFGEYSVRLASALACHCEVLLVLPENEVKAHRHLLDPAVVFQSLRLPRLRQPIRQMMMMADLCKCIRDFSPHVVHLQQGHMWFNLALNRLPRCRFVLTVHDFRAHPGDLPSSKTPQWVLDLAIRRADDIIVHARHVRNQVVTKYHIAGSRVHVIPHIKLGEDKHAPKPKSGNAPTVLFFGRIWQYKGLEYLIRAEPSITSRIPDVQIVIAGEGEDLSRYRRIMVHPERFRVFNGYISEARATELFRDADVVVLPYTEASQSGVIPMAYTFSKPVVATTVGGLPEMVEHERTGLCVPPRDERALADAVVTLLQNDKLASVLGTNGNRKINSECSPSEVARKTVEVYRCPPFSSLVKPSAMCVH